MTVPLNWLIMIIKIIDGRVYINEMSTCLIKREIIKDKSKFQLSTLCHAKVIFFILVHGIHHFEGRHFEINHFGIHSLKSTKFWFHLFKINYFKSRHLKFIILKSTILKSTILKSTILKSTILNSTILK